MCGRFDALVTWAFYHDALYLEPIPFVTIDAPLKTIAPTVTAPIIIKDTKGTPKIIEARFGLIPHWHKASTKDFKATTFNARLETAFEKPVFRDAFHKQHCIIPASCFYEWTGDKPPKAKWRISRQSNEPMSLAGLWARHVFEGIETLSFCILTRSSGHDMSPIHHREPVQLSAEDLSPWLDHRLDATQLAYQALRVEAA